MKNFRNEINEHTLNHHHNNVLIYLKTYSARSKSETISHFDKNGNRTYYKTDSHWSQNKIVDVADVIAYQMKTTINKEFYEHKCSKFYGVYYGQLGLKTISEDLIYLTFVNAQNLHYPCIFCKYTKIYR